jgi:hypothetical protein
MTIGRYAVIGGKKYVYEIFVDSQGQILNVGDLVMCVINSKITTCKIIQFSEFGGFAVLSCPDSQEPIDIRKAITLTKI